MDLIKYRQVMLDIQSEIEAADNIVITGHVNPDGDAIASSLSMQKALKVRYPDKKVLVTLENIPSSHMFIEGAKDILSFEELKKEMPDVDLCISVDFSESYRAGEREYIITDMAKVNVVIDHHEIDKSFGKFNLIDSTYPAAAQLIYVFLKEMGYKIDKELLSIIICGIITDTGGFRFPSTNLLTFDIAKLALSLGVDISTIYDKLLFTKSINQIKIQSLANSRITIDEKYHIAYTYLKLTDEDFQNVKPGEAEGIVNVALGLPGVKVSIFFKEAEEGYKVSLRSKNDVDVSEICKRLGGGGHKKAAGVTIENHDYEVVFDIVMKETQKQIQMTK